MKFLDKFLKKLNTSRNTFFTYILTLITAYLAVDRIVEMLLMLFTGVSYSYWGPIKYYRIINNCYFNVHPMVKHGCMAFINITSKLC